MSENNARGRGTVKGPRNSRVIRFIKLDIATDEMLLNRISASRDRNRESSAKNTVTRLILESLMREEMAYERTGAALNATMPQPGGR